jgi:hypothetical protein
LEATVGISLYSCLYLKLAKTLCLSYYLFYVFSLIKSENKREEQVLPGSRWGTWEEGGGPQIMYIHVSKCKNNKRKGEKEKDCAIFRYEDL